MPSPGRETEGSLGSLYNHTNPIPGGPISGPAHFPKAPPPNTTAALGVRVPTDELGGGGHRYPVRRRRTARKGRGRRLNSALRTHRPGLALPLGAGPAGWRSGIGAEARSAGACPGHLSAFSFSSSGHIILNSTWARPPTQPLLRLQRLVSQLIADPSGGHRSCGAGAKKGQ